MKVVMKEQRDELAEYLCAQAKKRARELLRETPPRLRWQVALVLDEEDHKRSSQIRLRKVEQQALSEAPALVAQTRCRHGVPHELVCSECKAGL